MNKNSKKILWIAGLLIVFLALFWFGRGNGESNATLPVEKQIKSGNALTAEETFFDFGTIAIGAGKVEKTFAIANKTDADIKLDTLVTSCMCTNAYILRGEEKKGPFGMPGHGNTVPKANEIIKAGEIVDIEVVFDPAAHGPDGVGLAERSVYLVDNSGGALELKITANVIE